MSSSSFNDNDFQQREQELHEREMQLRLRELEVELEAQKKVVNNQATETTVIREMDQEALGKQRKLRKMLLFGKFAFLAIGVAILVVAIKIILLPVMVFGTLGLILYGVYILFVREPSSKKSSH